MPSQAREEAWARREEPQVFALNMCPGKSALLPAHPITLAWLIGPESPTQQVRNKSCLQEVLRQTDKPKDKGGATGPKKGED